MSVDRAGIRTIDIPSSIYRIHLPRLDVFHISLLHDRLAIIVFLERNLPFKCASEEVQTKLELVSGIKLLTIPGKQLLQQLAQMLSGRNEKNSLLSLVNSCCNPSGLLTNNSR